MMRVFCMCPLRDYDLFPCFCPSKSYCGERNLSTAREPVRYRARGDDQKKNKLALLMNPFGRDWCEMDGEKRTWTKLFLTPFHAAIAARERGLIACLAATILKHVLTANQSAC